MGCQLGSPLLLDRACKPTAGMCPEVTNRGKAGPSKQTHYPNQGHPAGSQLQLYRLCRLEGEKLRDAGRSSKYGGGSLALPATVKYILLSSQLLSRTIRASSLNGSRSRMQTQIPQQNSPAAQFRPAQGSTVEPDLFTLSDSIEEICEAAEPNPEPSLESVTQRIEQLDNALVGARLGAFCGLFYALRAKHPPTAAHSLRVALGCSRWAEHRKLDEETRSLLEVAALLHDVGKIGIPDNVLQKRSQLSRDEQLLMEMQHDISAELLKGSGAKDEILDMIRSSRGDSDSLLKHADSAAMLAIVDAFDSMTTEQVFRRALSKEAAIDELFSNTSTQFDPELVKDFAELIGCSRPELDAATASRWLQRFETQETPGFDSDGVYVTCRAKQNIVDTIFQPRLMHAMSDAAVFLDSSGQVLLWNRSAENLTGRQAGAVLHRLWDHDVMGLVGQDGSALSPEACPLAQMRKTNTKFTQRLSIVHVDGRRLAVSFTVQPVFSGAGEYCGAILLVRDASAQEHLEQRVESLSEIVSTDPLTKVANRAALSKHLPEFMAEHLESGQPGSLMICDIDFFKKINDTYGHQAGDEALVTFAGILNDASRQSDFVARYGGEEFVIVCPGCDNSSATARAEEIRLAVLRTPVPALGGRTMTASFGVTEIQAGDSHELLIARADRALLQAKETGRNRVVQVGAGHRAAPEKLALDATELAAETQPEQRRASWISWFRKSEDRLLVEKELLANVPCDMAVQKLAGFIHDHEADVLEADERRVLLRVDMNKSRFERRSGERPAVLLMEISLLAVDFRTAKGSVYQSRTKLAISIRSVKSRDRRQVRLQRQAGQLLSSISSYLVTQEISEALRLNIIEPR